jgi:hypothetical protein
MKKLLVCLMMAFVATSMASESQAKAIVATSKQAKKIIGDWTFDTDAFLAKMAEAGQQVPPQMLDQLKKQLSTAKIVITDKQIKINAPGQNQTISYKVIKEEANKLILEITGPKGEKDENTMIIKDNNSIVIQEKGQDVMVLKRAVK